MFQQPSAPSSSPPSLSHLPSPTEDSPSSPKDVPSNWGSSPSLNHRLPVFRQLTTHESSRRREKALADSLLETLEQLAKELGLGKAPLETALVRLEHQRITPWRLQNAEVLARNRVDTEQAFQLIKRLEWFMTAIHRLTTNIHAWSSDPSHDPAQLDRWVDVVDKLGKEVRNLLRELQVTQL